MTIRVFPRRTKWTPIDDLAFTVKAIEEVIE